MTTENKMKRRDKISKVRSNLVFDLTLTGTALAFLATATTMFSANKGIIAYQQLATISAIVTLFCLVELLNTTFQANKLRKTKTEEEAAELSVSRVLAGNMHATLAITGLFITAFLFMMI